MKFLSQFLIAVFYLLLGAASPIFSQNVGNEEKKGFVKITDGSLYYEQMGSGVPIIVVHGGPGLDQGYLKPQLLQLAAKHQVIFYDQRGSGNSLETPLDEKHINIDQFVADLDVLRQSLGIEKFILLGHSWGCFVAMQYAIAHQDHLIGMVLSNSAPANYAGQKAFIDAFTVKSKDIQQELLPLFIYDELKKLEAIQLSTLYQKLFSVYFYNQNKVQELNLNFSPASAQSGFKVMEMMAKTSWLQTDCNLIPQLKRLNISTLVLSGKEDLVPIWTAQEIKEAIPHAEMVVLDQCGHFPYIEQPAQFFSALNKFMLKISPN